MAVGSASGYDRICDLPVAGFCGAAAAPLPQVEDVVFGRVVCAEAPMPRDRACASIPCMNLTVTDRFARQQGLPRRGAKQST
jgi:hypothetical protein